MIDDMDQKVNNEDEVETCPLCPDTQPPSASSPSFKDVRVDTEGKEVVVPEPRKDPVLKWLGCTSCDDKWYHTACLAQEIRRESQMKKTVMETTSGEAGEKKPEFLHSITSTFPEPLVEQLLQRSFFWDYTPYFESWYCLSCVSGTSKAGSSRSSRTAPKAKLRDDIRLPAVRAVRKQDAKGYTSSSLNGNGAEQTNGSGKSRPKRQAAMMQPDYKALHNSIPTPTYRWLDLIAHPEKTGRTISDRPFTQVDGSCLDKAWLDTEETPPGVPSPSLFFGPDREPIIIPKSKGGFTSLGGRVPDPKLSFQDVANLVGREQKLDVVDVATQGSSKWSLGDWADYITDHSSEQAEASSSRSRQKVYNVISLEISGTELAKKVRPPKLVSEIDWVDRYWPDVPEKRKARKAYQKDDTPADIAEEEEEAVDANGTVPIEQGRADWPKVQLYCLMGMKGSFTDWHLDMGSTSVYYTVHTGSKTFFFIKPTESNLSAYAKWSSSEDSQNTTWLGDLVDEVRKVTLMAGDTMIIPAGYIHAVHTPLDSLVFGGNFLHSYNIENQIRLRDMEIALKVPQRYRFPFFDRLCWYAATHFCQQLRDSTSWRRNPTHKTRSETNPVVLKGFLHLSRFLLRELRTMETSLDDKQRRTVQASFPADMTQDPAALARELRWRCKRALGEESDDEEEMKALTTAGVEKGRVTKKRKMQNGRAESQAEEKDREIIVFGPRAKTKNVDHEPWTVDTADETVFHSSISRDRKEFPQPTLDLFPDPSGTEEDNDTLHGERTERTTHQVRKRTRKGRNGDVIEEEQEVIVRTRVVRFVGPDRTRLTVKDETPAWKETDAMAGLTGLDERRHLGQDVEMPDDARRRGSKDRDTIDGIQVDP